MRILLLGEYSRLHNSLKEGLITLNNDVTIVGSGDDFKKFNVDYSIHSSIFSDYWFTRKIKNALYKLTRFDLQKTERGIRFYFLLNKLKGFDQVQLINSDALETHPILAKWLLKKLFKQNKKISLLICGDETPVIDFYLKKEQNYSILTPLIEDFTLQNEYYYVLKYQQKNYRKLFEFINSTVNCLIVSDLDYKIPMDKMGYNTTFIPNPVNTDKIKNVSLRETSKITIFLGINRISYIKKGICFFEDALKIIAENYSNKVEIIITENVPYNTYINSYNKAHIVLDQVYAYDQGYNALEAMAKGKVVVTGAELNFENHYNLTKKVAINALPNVKYIVKELTYLINNPEEINAIGLRAKLFIEKEHNYKMIAKRYLETWSK